MDSWVGHFALLHSAHHWFHISAWRWAFLSCCHQC